MIKLVALSGPKGSGKTTAAHWLEIEHGWRRLAFAGPIRDAVLDLFPQWDASVFTPARKDALCPFYRITPRDALRAFGEHARALDPNIYIKAMQRRIDALPLGCCVVIDDLRLPAEAAWVRAHGGAVVHVRRAGRDWSGEHATEVGPGVTYGDLWVRNDTDLAALKRELAGVCCA